jgi:hypothetical protein
MSPSPFIQVVADRAPEVSEESKAIAALLHRLDRRDQLLGEPHRHAGRV